jgi:hypothetical protein
MVGDNTGDNPRSFTVVPGQGDSENGIDSVLYPVLLTVSVDGTHGRFGNVYTPESPVGAETPLRVTEAPEIVFVPEESRTTPVSAPLPGLTAKLRDGVPVCFVPLQSGYAVTNQ